MERLTYSPVQASHPFHRSPNPQYQVHPTQVPQSMPISNPRSPASASFHESNPSALGSGHLEIRHTPPTDQHSGGQFNFASDAEGRAVGEDHNQEEMLFMDLGGSAFDALESMMAGPSGTTSEGVEMNGLGEEEREDIREMAQRSHQEESQDLDGLFLEMNGLSNVVSPGQYFDFDMANFAGLDGGNSMIGRTGLGGEDVEAGKGEERFESGFQGDGGNAADFDSSIGPGGVKLQGHPGTADAVRNGGMDEVIQSGPAMAQPAVSDGPGRNLLLDALHAGLLEQQLQQFQLQSPALLAGLGHQAAFNRSEETTRQGAHSRTASSSNGFGPGQSHAFDHIVSANGSRCGPTSSPRMSETITTMGGQCDGSFPSHMPQKHVHTQPAGYMPMSALEHMDKETLMGLAQGFGLLTPGNSTELVARPQTEMVSPLPQDYLNSLEGDVVSGARNFTPMISPAITSHGTSSLQASPNFRLASPRHPIEDHASQSRSTDTQSQLEAIRRQQIDIQRQLDRLSRQQVPEPVNAAGPSHTTGYEDYTDASIPPPFAPHASHHRLANSFNIPTNRSDSMTPLTSPALKAYNARSHTRSHSIASTMPSPALGSNQSQRFNQWPNGGSANQPVQGPNAPLDQAMLDYLANLANLLEPSSSGHFVNQTIGNGHGALDAGHVGGSGSGAHTPTSDSGQLHGMSNSVSASVTMASPQTFRKEARSAPVPASGPGPHRSYQSGRTRPSPMLRPTGRPPRNSTGSNGASQYSPHHAHGSVPPSPLVSAHMPGRPMEAYANGITMRECAPPMLPVDLLAAESNLSSTSGSLSPVDLTAGVMSGSVPPSPNRQKVRRGSSGVAPLTPATLMQLGRPSSVPSSYKDDRRPSGKDAQKRIDVDSRPQFVRPEGVPPKHARQPMENGGSLKRTAGTSVLSGETLEGLRGLKEEALAIKIANAKALARPNRPVKKQEEEIIVPPEIRKTSHKAAEQKRRDSLKASFDELRLLLPPINIEALDPESGEPIPGSSAPRLLPKSSLVPDDNPNKGVSKVALLKFSNDYLARLHTKMERRENYIDLLKQAIRSMRGRSDAENDGSLDELLDYEFEDEEDEEVTPDVKAKGKERVTPGDSDDDELEEDVEEIVYSGSAPKKESKRGRPPSNATARPKISNRKSNTKVQAVRTTGTRRITGSSGMVSALTDSPRLLASQGVSGYGQDDVQMD